MTENFERNRTSTFCGNDYFATFSILCGLFAGLPKICEKIDSASGKPDNDAKVGVMVT